MIISYIDKINKQKIEIDVSDEVATFINTDNQRLRRQRNKINYYEIDIDSVDEDILESIADENTIETIEDQLIESEDLNFIQVSIRRTIKKLTLIRQYIIVKKWFNLKTLKEIAVILHKKTPTISKVHKRILAKMADLLKNDIEFANSWWYKSKVYRDYLRAEKARIEREKREEEAKAQQERIKALKPQFLEVVEKTRALVQDAPKFYINLIYSQYQFELSKLLIKEQRENGKIENLESLQDLAWIYTELEVKPALEEYKKIFQYLKENTDEIEKDIVNL